MAITSSLRRPAASDRTLAAVGMALAVVIIVFANADVPKGENGGTGPAVFTAVLCVVLTAALFGYVLPRARDAQRTALVLAVVAVVSVVAFWSGVTPVLAAAAVSAAGRGAGSSDRKTSVLLGLAALASALAVVVTLAQSSLL